MCPQSWDACSAWGVSPLPRPPIPQPAPLIRHRQYPDQLTIELVVQGVRKPIQPQLAAPALPGRAEARETQQQLHRGIEFAFAFEGLRDVRPCHIEIPAYGLGDLRARGAPRSRHASRRAPVRVEWILRAPRPSLRCDERFPRPRPWRCSLACLAVQAKDFAASGPRADRVLRVAIAGPRLRCRAAAWSWWAPAGTITEV
jgi:hypothetical protein